MRAHRMRAVAVKFTPRRAAFKLAGRRRCIGFHKAGESGDISPVLVAFSSYLHSTLKRLSH